MDTFDWQIAMTLGLLLAAALFAGGLAGWLKVPKVTTYLLVGFFLGMSHWVDEHHITFLEPLTKLAIALVLFNLGCHFPLARARRLLRRTLRLSLGELSTTFLLVTVGLVFLGYPSWEGALMLGTLALATAPATTILVLKETESEGLLTEYINALVALNNLVSILLFEMLLLGIMFFQGALEVPVAEQLGGIALVVVGSILLGVGGGLVVSFFFGLVSESRRLVLLFAVMILLLGVCHHYEMLYLLTFLAMGVVVANSSDQTRQILAELDRLTGLLCVVFFVVHGAELKPDALGKAGLFGFAYIMLRFVGKYFGTRLAATTVSEDSVVRNWLGTALIAQAGAAIALSANAVDRTVAGSDLNTLCRDVQTIILGTVVVFELVGPILIRQSVLRAGEVPLAQAIRRPGTGMMEQARTLVNRLLIAMGMNPWKNRAPDELIVTELMRKNLKGITQAATFNDVLAEIEHSRDNTYPVVGPSGELVGVIRYRELSNAMFDPALGALVRAADVMTHAGWVLHPDETISRAYEMFEAAKDDCLPVVTREKPYQYLGLVRRRDVLRLLIREQKDV